VLLCTDVASRGVDIARLTGVVNFDPPASTAQYVHRAGRTGRQGAHGCVVSLLRPGAECGAFALGAARLFEQAKRAIPEELEAYLATAGSAADARLPARGPECQAAPAAAAPIVPSAAAPAAKPATQSLADFAAAFAIGDL
jgi:superfamily II DNA/RNA helicase